MFDKSRAWIKENKGKAIAFGFVGAILFGISQYVLITSTSTPAFCQWMCHNMIPDVVAYKESSHAKRGLVCVDCHFKEGFIGYMTAKVMAQVDVLNTVTGAMGHGVDYIDVETEMIQKDRRYRGMKLIVLPQYLRYPDQYKEYPGMKPDTMISSHADEEGMWMIKPIRGTILRRNIRENCTNCHSKIGNRGRRSPKDVADFIVRNQLLDFTGKVERRRKGIIIPHAIHLDKGFNCLDCHAEIVHGAVAMKDENGVIMPRMPICFQCHNDKRAPRDCTLCHKLQLRMNLGVEGIGVPDSANYMYPDNAVCPDCHLEENNYKMSGAIGKKVCVEECHEPGQDEILMEWQDQTRALLAKIEPGIRALQADIDNAKKAGRNVGPAEELFNDANYNYRFVKDDGSKGAHNVDYAESLIGVAQEKLEMARDLIGQ